MRNTQTINQKKKSFERTTKKMHLCDKNRCFSWDKNESFRVVQASIRNKVARSIRNTHKEHARKETSKQQRKCPRTQEAKWKKTKTKTQKTGGQMKTCDVKNHIFCRRRVPFMRLCTYGDKNRRLVEIKIKALVCCSTFLAKQITCNISLSKGTSKSFIGDQYKRNRTSKNPKISKL